VIFCIKAMAAQHYDLDVQIVRIQGTEEYESCIFDGSADLICEHLEYLYDEAARGRHRGTMFLCPVNETDSQLVAGPETTSVDDLRGKRIAVRDRGRPYAIAMAVRQLGLAGDVELVTVADDTIGRWAQWKTILSGECAATFVPCLNIAPALEAGLRVLEVPQLAYVGHFGHACATDYAASHDDVMVRYVKAAIHAVALIKLRRDEAMQIVAEEPARLMNLDQDPRELARQLNCIAESLQLKPYPTPASLENTYEIACAEWPDAAGINPLTLWDLHWVKQLDDEGFIDTLVRQLQA
jgi:ABC-type nitrate/sulfonate/bicarbonate transport system substrate-binding protein